MEMTPGIFMFIVALAAVVNGLGMVSIVGGMGELIRRRESLNISFSLVHSLLVLFQLLAHVLLWWSFIFSGSGPCLSGQCLATRWPLHGNSLLAG
jgi:hypothetical protein